MDARSYDSATNANMILGSTLCAGILREFAEKARRGTDDEFAKKYDLDDMIRGMGSDEVTERALSMTMSWDGVQNREWLKAIGILLKSVYNVVARVVNEGVNNGTKSSGDTRHIREDQGPRTERDPSYDIVQLQALLDPGRGADGGPVCGPCDGGDVPGSGGTT